MTNISLGNKLWSESTWQRHLPIYHITQQVPFIQELITGTLEAKRFHFYIEQDALYLQAFTKLLQTMANRIEEPMFQSYFHTFVQENMEQEKTLHDLYLNREISTITPSETCRTFIAFNATLETLPIPLALAGMLPCFLVYQQLGLYIFDQHLRENNPYLDWIDTYAGIEHLESVTRLRTMCDYYAKTVDEKTLEQMHQWYEKGAIFDQKFWNSCYQMA